MTTYRYPQSRDRLHWADSLARGLGWFSIRLGVAEVPMPGVITKPLGLERRDGALRGSGAREIATGVAILASDNPAP